MYFQELLSIIVQLFWKRIRWIINEQHGHYLMRYRKSQRKSRDLADEKKTKSLLTWVDIAQKSFDVPERTFASWRLTPNINNHQYRQKAAVVNSPPLSRLK